MIVGYFTEMPMSAYPEDAARHPGPEDHPALQPNDTILLFSNRHLDPGAASRILNEHLDCYVLAEEVGFDGLMTNEHHFAPFCMQARCNIMTALVAAKTKRVKLLQMGNPLPLWDNPVQCAEEVALIDMASGGRVAAGIVRGGGQEQLAMNTNPAFNRDRFTEAHDLIIQAWTRPGPFRWEGEHYDFRVVNPWALPVQKPHPPIFMPGVSSPETVAFAAEHGYPYVCLGTTLEETNRIVNIYGETATRLGYTPGPEHLGYVMRCFVGATEEHALDNAMSFLWMRGEFTGVGQTTWSAPTGYSSITSRRARINAYKRLFDSLQAHLERGSIVAGTADQVSSKITAFLRAMRPGTLVLWGHDGKVAPAAAHACIRRLGEHVVPRIREVGQRLELKSPFEATSGAGYTTNRRAVAV